MTLMGEWMRGPLSRFQASAQSPLHRILLYAFALAAIVILFAVTGKFWQSNDDPNMAMIAQGTGIASVPSPGIVYSNIVWGWVLEHGPSIAGIQFYALANYALLAASLTAILYALDKARVPALLSAAIVMTAYGPIAVNMEFTVVSGYLAAAGMALACIAVRSDGYRLWVAAGLLLIFGALIRGLELPFVVFVTFPLFLFFVHEEPGTSKRYIRLVMPLVMVGAVLWLCRMLDARYYSSTDWDLYNSISGIRNLFVNYNLGVYFAKHPELIAGSPLSRNDIDLISNWFYLDPSVFNAATFDPIMRHVSWLERVRLNLHFLRSHFLSPFTDPQTLVFIGLLVFLVPLHARPRVAFLACILLLACMLLLWAAGRPGILRIYTPVFLALTVLIAMGLNGKARGLAPLLGFAGVITALGLFAYSHAQLSALESEAAPAQAEVCAIPRDKLIVNWGNGNAFRYRYVLRPFAPMGQVCDLHYYPIGALELTPSALDQLYAATGGKDLVEALMSGQTFYLLSGAGRLDMLRTFFKEHYDRTLSATLVKQGDAIELYEIGIARH